jgi:hypothetical protein
VKGPNPLHRYTTTPTNRRCTCKCTASICTTRAKNGFPKAATNAAVASAQEVRLAHRVGAPSRRLPPSGHTSTWEVQATGVAEVREGARVVPRSKQPSRSQSAEETRGPQSGRSQEWQRAPTRKLPRSGGREYECRAPAFAIRGVVLDAATSLFADRALNLALGLSWAYYRTGTRTACRPAPARCSSPQRE